jgi:hypothetical protein
MAQLSDPRAELAARAVRDLLADCLVTLPALIEREAAASMHFWFANFTALRRMLFPRLATARAAWTERGDLGALHAALEDGRAHWERVALRLAAEGPATGRRIAEGDASFRL